MSKTNLISKFKNSFKRPNTVTEWEQYVSNPEMPEDDIPDFYGDVEDWDDSKQIDNALEQIGKSTDKDWKHKATIYLNKAFLDFIKEFKTKAKFKGNLLEIYRTVTTHGYNEELIENFNDPNFEAGIYWSWTPEPSSHWGGRGRAATITGLVDINSIDIHKSLIKNLHPTLGEEETEIELKPKSTVVVTQVNEGRNNVLWQGKKTVKANHRNNLLVTVLNSLIFNINNR